MSSKSEASLMMSSTSSLALLPPRTPSLGLLTKPPLLSTSSTTTSSTSRCPPRQLLSPLLLSPCRLLDPPRPRPRPPPTGSPRKSRQSWLASRGTSTRAQRPIMGGLLVTKGKSRARPQRRLNRWRRRRSRTDWSLQTTFHNRQDQKRGRRARSRGASLRCLPGEER